jgi:hypothetical protein
VRAAKPWVLLVALGLSLPGCSPAERTEPLSGYMLLGGELVSDLPAPFDPALAALTVSLVELGFRAPAPPPAPSASPGREGSAPAPPAARPAPPSATDQPTEPPRFRSRRLREQDLVLFAQTREGESVSIRLRGTTTGSRLAVRIGPNGNERASLELLRAVRARVADLAAEQAAFDAAAGPPRPPVQ